MTTIFGIGNPNRSDDAVGPLVLAALEAESLPSGVTLEPYMGDGMGLVSALEDCDRAILIDAVVEDGPAGELVIIDCNDTHIPPQNYLCSSHGFGLNEAIEMARTLGVLPSWCYILGIRAEALSVGHGLSSPVRAAVPSAVEWVGEQLLPA